MPAPPRPGKDASGRMLSVVFTAVIGSFLATIVIAQVTSRSIGSDADGIVTNSSPSIRDLATLRGATLETELALSEYLHQGGAPSEIGARIDSAVEKVKSGVDGYLALPAFPEEQPRHAELQEAWIRFDESVRRTRQEADANDAGEARQMFAGLVDARANRLIDAALRAIEFNAQAGRMLAARITKTRHRTIWLSNALAASCVVLGLAGALLLHRQTRSRRALVEAHAKFLEDRAAELEQFAGRVAHDIRNPLATAVMGADLLLRRVIDEPGKELLNRIVRSLSRATTITTGLLDFARSGARPDPGARTNVQEVIADLAAGIGPDAENARIDLRFDPVPPVLVACSTGVYLSILGNLVRNALKYMGHTATRRITVRVTAEGEKVRTEVSDTGPGIPEEKLPSLFDAYFRADRDTDGLGLGLATVKKLAEGHDGVAGVTTASGHGSTFWFVLPRAGSRCEPPANGARDERAAEIRHRS
jgi:signal transduction histidine kinase